jgi:hypothetical protein
LHFGNGGAQLLLAGAGVLGEGHLSDAPFEWAASLPHLPKGDVMSLGRLHLGAAILLFASCPLAFGQQTVVFDNFGPNNTYDNGGTWMGSGFNEVMFSASTFTPTASGKLTQFDAGMWTFPLDPTPPNQATLYLLTQVGDVPPTTAHSIWTQSYSGNLASNLGGIATFPVSNGPALTAGEQYWLYVEVPLTPSASSPQYFWNQGLSGSNETAFYFAQSPTRPQTWQIFDPAVNPGRSLRVTAVVPEPAAGVLLAVGAACLRVRRRTRDHGRTRALRCCGA